MSGLPPYRNISVATECVVDGMSIGPEDRTAVRARVRNLARLGVLSRNAPGRGASQPVSVSDFRRLCWGARLSISGFPQQAVIDILAELSDGDLSGEEVTFSLPSPFGKSYGVVKATMLGGAA